MKISKIIIEPEIEKKIFYKHNITVFEIEEVLLSNPYISKTKHNKYIAINWFQKYITIENFEKLRFSCSLRRVLMRFPSEK